MSNVYSPHFKHPKGTLIRKQGVGIMFAHGTTVPADASSGYAAGCIFLHTDGVDGDHLYVNEGTDTSCDFNAYFRPLGEVVAATNVITAAETGKTFFLSHATEFASTLPAPALGLHYRFFVADAPESANYTITTTDSANIILGQIYTTDVNSATDPAFTVTGVDTITIVAAKAVLGDSVDVFCDGTNWFARVFTSVFDAVTFDTAS